MPPWLPATPPHRPDASPNIDTAGPTGRHRFAIPVHCATAVISSRATITRPSTDGPSYVCSSAPASPPTALNSPKRFSTSKAMCARRRQHRTAVATACGSETAATASEAPSDAVSNGVSMLPMPKPRTEAVAPESTPTPKTATRKRATATHNSQFRIQNSQTALTVLGVAAGGDRPHVHDAVALDGVEHVVQVDGRVGVRRTQTHTRADRQHAVVGHGHHRVLVVEGGHSGARNALHLRVPVVLGRRLMAAVEHDAV